MSRHSVAFALILTGCLEERAGQRQADTEQPSEVENGQDSTGQPLVEVPFRIRTFEGPITGEVCYDAQVLQGDRVTWSRGDLTTTSRGAPQSGPPLERLPVRAPDTDTLCADGGDLTWTATCDPRLDSDPSRPGSQAELRVFFDDAIWDYPAELRAPCQEGCTVAFDCAAGEDALTFDLGTSLWIGGGFVDTYDTLGDFACSARRTSCHELLESDDGERLESTVLAFSCVWPSGDAAPRLELADLRLALGSVAVVCDGRRLALAPLSEAPTSAEDGDLRLRYQTSFGVETFEASLVRLYYNVVIETARLVDFDACRLEWSATAFSKADAIFEADEATADALVHPFFVVEAELSRDGELVCDANVDQLPVQAAAVLHGTVPEYPPLPARCFEFGGLPPTPTGHPGCE